MHHYLAYITTLHTSLHHYRFLLDNIESLVAGSMELTFDQLIQQFADLDEVELSAQLRGQLRGKVMDAVPQIVEVTKASTLGMINLMKSNADSLCPELYERMDVNDDGLVDKDEFVSTFLEAITEHTEGMQAAAQQQIQPQLQAVMMSMMDSMGELDELFDDVIDDECVA